MTAFFKDQAWLASLSRGVILHTDGRLQRTACVGGLDLEAAQPVELVGMWAKINDTLRTLGPEWLVLVQTYQYMARVEKVEWFPTRSAMPIAIASKAGSNGRDHQFEIAYYLTFELWCAAMRVRSRYGCMLESRGREQSASASGYVNGFIERTDRVLRMIERIVPAARGFLRKRRWPTRGHAWRANTGACDARSRLCSAYGSSSPPVACRTSALEAWCDGD
jgi:type IV secretion system protein VirB4